VAIVADPGMGKTSLLGAVADAFRDGGEAVAVGYADSLERSIPFRAWSTIYATLLEVDPDDRERTRETLRDRVGPLAPLLSPVLGLEIEETPETAALGGEQRLAATRTLLLDLLASAIDRAGRLNVLFEDAHWFDSASWGLLAEAVGRPGLAVVLTTRPEAGPAQGRRPSTKRMITAASIISRSASGSAYLPNSDSTCQRRASQPSIWSVTPATPKTIPAAQSWPPSARASRTTKIGINRNRAIVSALGSCLRRGAGTEAVATITPRIVPRWSRP
jgi:hypothetical protein